MLHKHRMSRKANEPNEDRCEEEPSDSWEKIAKTVREVDLEKVANTKEDIDTLLVFAGLFSAVVTTFVVDSYSNLTPDNTDEIVFLMRQSLAQNYTFVDGVLRPVVPFPGDPPFVVPSWALRVNGLWFASLIVSLSTASFGMLVKQWLIEYMAMEWISPEERLRARQYRYTGLRDWKVFEIAAMLPLLLHLSLGLFFIGLCLYTAAANTIIGRSTLPLVAGWASFALLTVVAPLASPRCPYKITLLKTALRMGRIYATCHLRKLLTFARNVLVSSVLAASLFAATRMGQATTKALISLRQLLRNARDARLRHQLRAYGYGWYGRLLYLPYDLSIAISLWMIVSLPQLLTSSMHTTLFLLSRYFQSDTSDEEVHLMRQTYQTHDLLLSVDKFITNDGPILKNMAEVFTQTQVPAPSTTAFVLGCIKHRVGKESRVHWEPSVNGHVRGLPDLSMLSEGAWTTLVDLMAESLSPRLHGITDEACLALESEQWIETAITVVLAWSPHPLPPKARAMVSDPVARATILHLLRRFINSWPQQHIVDIVGIALTADRRSAETISYTTWDHLLHLDAPTPIAVQEPVIQILLRLLPAESSDRENALEAHTIEANLMLASILNTPLPSSYSQINGQELRSSYQNGSTVITVSEVANALPTGHNTLSTPLAAAVGTSPDLLKRAIRFYNIVALGFEGSNQPLWSRIMFIQIYRLQTPPLRTVMRDLWSFMLLCARSFSNNGEEHLQIDEFIKLCIVLLGLGAPLILGVEDPAGDWRELVPVLAKTADKLIANDIGVAPGHHIPYLAKRASAQLLRDIPGVFQELQAILGRLSSPGIQAVQGETSAKTTVSEQCSVTDRADNCSPLPLATGGLQSTR